MNQKVTLKTQPAVEETPTQRIVRQSSEAVDVSDARGRVITLKKPGDLAKLDFIEALGESSSNRMWASMVWNAMYVSAIDGLAVTTPIVKPEVRALYQRLGEDGMKAVNDGANKHFGASESDDVDIDAAKK